MAHRRSGEIPPPFSPLRRRNGQRRLADTGVFGSGKRLGPVVAYITIRMADRSKTSAPTYPPVTSFTHTHTRARAFPWPRTRDRAPLRVYQRARSTTLFDALHAFNDRIPLSCTRPPFQPPSSSSCAMEPTVERMFRGSEWKKRRKARARCWKLARGGAKQSVIGRKGRDGWKHSIDLSLKARMIRRGILVRVTRSVLFRARFRITWERGERCLGCSRK